MTLHDTAWMGEQIGKSADWVRHNIAEIPHRRIGRTIRFTDQDLADYLESQAVRPIRMQTTGPKRRRTA